ncbi:MAG: DUF4168 domain-containing protein [Alcanivorax sp.]|uniref:DUF4168 domain-containing protein n=1 Tax=Alcanivorax sp. TaxID=1872427 RepID=UPI003DA7A69B
MKKPITAMAALLFSSALSATATAQQPGSSGAPQQGAPQSQNMPQQQNLPDASEFSDADLDAFVATQKDMAGIQQKYSQKLQANKDKPKKAMEVKQEAQQKMVEAVEDNGLELKKYNQIVRLAQHDADFRASLQEKL